MQLSRLIETAADTGTVPASEAADACKALGLSSTEFCDVFARSVATGFLSGTYSWESSDAAMNGLSGYGFALSSHHSLPDFAFGVFLAFDAGETLLPPANETVAREQLSRLLNPPNQSSEPTLSPVTPPAEQESRPR